MDWCAEADLPVVWRLSPIWLGLVLGRMPAAFAEARRAAAAVFAALDVHRRRAEAGHT